jgi:multidrug efflux pump subunit AcrB
VPIDQITRLEFSSVPPIIERFNRERSDLVKSQVRAGYHVGKVTAAVGEEIAKLNWPAGLRWAFTGEVESQEESFGGTGEILLIAAFGIFAILVLESGSFRATLLVASVFPLGLIGGVTALWVTSYSLSSTSASGFIALIGMEIKTPFSSWTSPISSASRACHSAQPSSARARRASSRSCSRPPPPSARCCRSPSRAAASTRPSPS